MHHLSFGPQLHVFRERFAGKNTFAMQSMLNAIDIITIVIFIKFVFKTFRVEITNISTRLAKPNLTIAPVSPVVCAMELFRHFPDLCDGWYKADDIVTILVHMFALADAQLVSGILNGEISNDPATMIVVEANKNEVGIYRRSLRKSGRNSKHDIAPPITQSNHWKNKVRSSVLP